MLNEVFHYTVFSNQRLDGGKVWEHIVPPKGSVFLKQRVGYKVGAGIYFQFVSETVWGRL